MDFGTVRATLKNGTVHAGILGCGLGRQREDRERARVGMWGEPLYTNREGKDLGRERVNLGNLQVI
jgi:hypothetical protein